MTDYAEISIRQIPRLLSLMDREVPSKTYGSFDRTFWGWKFTDFSGSRFQEGLYALSWLYSTRLDGNEYFQNPLIKEWIEAGFSYWTTLQHRDGSFDEAYPFERSLAATSFTTFYLGEAFLRVDGIFDPDARAKILYTFQKSGAWLCKNDEHHGILSNHLAAAAAALLILSKIESNDEFLKRSKCFIHRILSHQSDEGWYEEYGGADFGYQTHGTFYLARYWEISRDDILLTSLKKSIQFMAHFIHPNGTIGGEYGSRNTSFYFPAGFEILAEECPEAASIACFMRNSVELQKAAGLDMMDAYNFFPLLNNYFFAHDAQKVISPAPLPFQGDHGQYSFPKAGLLVHVTQKYYAVFAPSKGGVLKIYDKTSRTLSYSDCGYWSVCRGSVRISSQSFSSGNEVVYGVNTVRVRTEFAKVKQKIMSPFLFIAFRGFMMTIGRQKSIALFIKNILVKILVKGRDIVDIHLDRQVTFEQGKVTIEDNIVFGKGIIPRPQLFLNEKFSTIHMGSARYFQSDELEPEVIEKNNAKEKRKHIWVAS